MRPSTCTYYALLALAACAPTPDLTPVRFTDVTAACGLDFRMHSGSQVKNYIIESKGGGGAFSTTTAMAGSTFTWSTARGLKAIPTRPRPRPTPSIAIWATAPLRTIPARPGSVMTGWGMGCAAADYDGDGDLDLYVTNYGPNVLYRNEGNGQFRDLGKVAGVDLAGWSTSATFGDYDRDGDLDLYVAQYLQFAPEHVPPRGGMWKGVLVFAGPLGLPGAQDVLYRNEGNGQFRDVTRQARAGQFEPTYGLSALFCDYDQDGDPDLYVANDSAPNFLYRNEGNGQFRDVGVEAGAALSAEGGAQAGMGIAYGDYDGDGDGDFLVTHFEDDYNTLYGNQGDGRFAVVSAAAGLAEPSLPHLAFGTFFLDYDNDQDQDLFVANGHVYPQIRHLNPDGYAEPNQLFANQGPAGAYRFAEVAAGDVSRPAVSRGAAKGDYDNDGDVDVLVFNLDGPPQLLRNDGGNQRNWLSLRLVGTASNRDGIGARVAVVSGGVEQIAERISGGSFLSHSDGRVHFGLGFNHHGRLDRDLLAFGPRPALRGCGR